MEPKEAKPSQSGEEHPAEKIQVGKLQARRQEEAKSLVPLPEESQPALHFHAICAQYLTSPPQLMREALHREATKRGMKDEEYLAYIAAKELSFVTLENAGYEVEHKVTIKGEHGQIEYKVTYS